MKKRIAFVWLAAMLLLTFAACESKEKEESSVGRANPWTEADREGVKSATGYDLSVPDEATNIVYSYMEDGNLAQVTYTINNNEWTYRVQATDELTDISGMYYEWVLEDEDTIGGHKAQLKAYVENNGDSEYLDDMFGVQVVNWYDETEGATHSVSVSGPALDGIDMAVYVENTWMKHEYE